MKVKDNQRLLNKFQVAKDFAQSVVLAVVVVEVLPGLIQPTGAFWLHGGPVLVRNARSHLTHGDCGEGYCAKRWNCRYPVTPTTYCGRWRNRKWICCTDRVGREMKPNELTTLPNPSPPPNLHVAGFPFGKLPFRPDSPDCTWPSFFNISDGRSSGQKNVTATCTTWQAFLILMNSLLNVTGCGIRGHIPSPRTNITGRSATSGSDFETFDAGSSPHAGGQEMIPQPGAVVGGREVDPYSWPWMAAIHRETVAGIRRFVCAGSLISQRYVLTAAHVFMPSDSRNPQRFLVVLGSHVTAEGLGLRAESITVHPSYRMRLYYNDIALVRLEKDIKFTDFVRPVCLPKPDDGESDLSGTEVTVIGWGDDSFGGVSSTVLREASFPVVSRQRCNNSYIRIASSTFPNGITQDMICAGSPSGGMDACQGDSGGPLTMQEGNRWTIVGIVSFGYRCGDSEYPGVYTRVSRYLSWIARYTDIIQR